MDTLGREILWAKLTMTLRVATDIGGTFTDLVYDRDGRIGVVKSDTVYPDFEQGVVNALTKSGIDIPQIEFFAHGTTIVINALTERKGVKTALITTYGFRDVLEIARGDTPDIFNVRYTKPKPFVPRYLRLEVNERMDSRGGVVTPIDLQQVDDCVRRLRSNDVASLAVCFLHAYANPEHEIAAVNRIRDLWPEVEVIASHEVCREMREYERTSTTVLAAYVLPPAKEYLHRLETRLTGQGVAVAPFIMQSNGGIATVESARANPITLVESGPVGGMLGAASYGQLIGKHNIIALDIGGTTAKCSLIHEGVTRITTEYVIEKTATSSGYPIKTPVIDIVEIGNGGGSIAWVDAAGALHVGPESAGSAPGPVAYGRGGLRPTTTDANLLTGRISPENFSGGNLSPDLAGVEQAFSKLGEELGVSAMHAAHGVIRIANANMVNALKLVSVNRGYDPRDFVLMAFGGGGALHATALAEELHIPEVIIPPNAGVFSAWGMLMLDLRRDDIRTLACKLGVDGVARVAKAFADLELETVEKYRDEGFAADQISHRRYVDARYAGQEHTVKIPFPDCADCGGALVDILARFHDEHEKEFTFCLEADVEVVNVHVVSFCRIERSRVAHRPAADPESSQTEPFGYREVDLDEFGIHQSPVYRRAQLLAGMRLSGPAIIEEPTTTTVVLPDNLVEVDEFGGLHIFKE